MDDKSIEVFECPECGVVLRHDGWGCCVTCGRDIRTVEFVPASELAAAQEEGRDHRRALSLACEAIEEHVSDLAVPADVGFYVAQARAEATDGGGE